MRYSTLSRRGGSVVETLEARRLLSVNLTVDGDTLTINGDAADNHVRIFDSNSGPIQRMVVSVDATGNGSYSDPGDVDSAIYNDIRRLIVRLGGGNDLVEITLADPLQNTTREYDIKTGRGNDIVRFSNPTGNDIRESNVNLLIDTLGGNDEVTLAINRVVDSTLNVDINTGNDDDRVRVFAGNDLINSDVSITAYLGSGNDLFENRIDWESVDLMGATSRWSVLAFGEAGDDTLIAAGDFGNNGADVYGTLAFNFQGGSGRDVITFDLDQFNLRGGTLFLRGNGGLGGDTLSFTGTINNVGGGFVDAALRGGVGIDLLRMNANAAPGLSYAAGGVILDGGNGFDTAVVSGNVPAILLNIEA